MTSDGEITEDQVIAKLKGKLGKGCNQNTLAYDLGISRPYLTQVLLRQSPPTNRILNQIGYRRVTRIVPLAEDGKQDD